MLYLYYIIINNSQKQGDFIMNNSQKLDFNDTNLYIGINVHKKNWEVAIRVTVYSLIVLIWKLPS